MATPLEGSVLAKGLLAGFCLFNFFFFFFFTLGGKRSDLLTPVEGHVTWRILNGFKPRECQWRGAAALRCLTSPRLICIWLGVSLCEMGRKDERS